MSCRGHKTKTECGPKDSKGFRDVTQSYEKCKSKASGKVDIAPRLESAKEAEEEGTKRDNKKQQGQ